MLDFTNHVYPLVPVSI